MFREIAAYVTRYPHLFGVLVYGQDPLAGKEDRYTEIEGHLFATQTIAQSRTTSFFFIKNSASLSIDKQTEEMFYRAFRFGTGMVSKDDEASTSSPK